MKRLIFTCIIFITLFSCNRKLSNESSDWVNHLVSQELKVANNKDFKSYQSAIVAKGERKKIEVDISALDTLWLLVLDGGNGTSWDHGVWANPVLVSAEGEETSLLDLEMLYSQTGWGEVLKNVNFNGAALSLAGKKVGSGLLTHAHAEMSFKVDKKFTKLLVDVGVDDGSKSGAKVRFVVSDQGLSQNFKALKKQFPVECDQLVQLLGESSAMHFLQTPTIEMIKGKTLGLIQKMGEPASVLTSKVKNVSTVKEMLQLTEEAWALKGNLEKLANCDLEALRKSINHMEAKYAVSALKDKDFIQKLNQLEEDFSILGKRIQKGERVTEEEMSTFLKKYQDVSQVLMASHPLLANQKIIFSTREQYLPDHHNSETLFQINETNTSKYRGGSEMKILDLANGSIETLLESDEAIFRDQDIHYDGGKFVYSMRENIEGEYHIYEMDLATKKITQLTKAKEVSDIDPCYLPTGQIVFSSTREPKYCMCNIHIMANLHRMEADGANITQLGKSTLFEGHTTVLPDGRLLYDRWEYVDRNYGDAQGLWTVNPDGTNHQIYWGNNTSAPGGVIDARAVPNTNKVIAVMGSCHDRPWGALALIDRSKGIDGKEPVVRTWPEYARDMISTDEQHQWDKFRSIRPRYEDPMPLDENYFLCVRTLNMDTEQTGIFLIDTFGNEILIHQEETLGCFDPVIIKSRKRERVIPETRKYNDAPGKLYVQNVYEGTHMEGVEKGTVKYLRVVESVEKKAWTQSAWEGQGVHRPAMNWHNFENKKVLGVTEVEEDGSAFFEVPSNRFVYFQLLDKNKKMVQTMRSGISLQPGETKGCIGCHDNRLNAPTLSGPSRSLALRKKPNKLHLFEEKGKPKSMGFLRQIQPILTDNCVSCHDFNKKAGKILNLAPDKNMFFNAAYIDLRMKGIVNVIGAGPAKLQKAYAWGASSSRLLNYLDSSHYNVKISEKEKAKIFEWLDVNAPYYPRFESAYPNNPAGRSPLTHEQVGKLSKLTGINLMQLATFRRRVSAQISFDRPELSACLTSIKGNKKKYQEALAIIKAGQQQLKEKPRADMAGFEPSPEHLSRLKKYIKFREYEKASIKAIQKGEKRYDQE